MAFLIVLAKNEKQKGVFKLLRIEGLIEMGGQISGVGERYQILL